MDRLALCFLLYEQAANAQCDRKFNAAVAVASLCLDARISRQNLNLQTEDTLQPSGSAHTLGGFSRTH